MLYCLLYRAIAEEILRRDFLRLFINTESYRRHLKEVMPTY